MTEPGEITALHHVGGERDDGDIVAVVRTLAAAGKFACVLGVNPGYTQRREPPLPGQELPAMGGGELNLRAFWRARAVVPAVRRWLDEAPRRVFHGHSPGAPFSAPVVAAEWEQVYARVLVPAGSGSPA